MGTKFRPLLTAEINAIRSARDAGKSITQLADFFRRSRTTIRDIIGPSGEAAFVKGRRASIVADKRPCTASEVCRYAEGGFTSVSHGLGSEHARRTLAAMTRGRTPLPGYPRTEGS